MFCNPRVIELSTGEQVVEELKKIKCDETGIRIMFAKALFKVIKLENLSVKAANLLKQTFLSKGGECAVSRGTASHRDEYTDVLICATLKQYQLALAQLRLQPWGLPGIAQAVDALLRATEIFQERSFEWKNQKLAIKKGKTLIMGILNLTLDSFSDGGKYNNMDIALRHFEEMVKDGADIIDIGAESTRPYNGPKQVSTEEELERLLPVLEQVLSISPVPVSVDTYKAVVADAALRRGAHIINDVWGLQNDPDMARVIAKYNVPVVIMHNQLGTQYEGDFMASICAFLHESIDIGVNSGINRNNIIVDPGIGFGKKFQDNMSVMAHLQELRALGCPILVGTSRKRFIGEVLDLPVEDRIEGTAATIALGIVKGASIVRVHDVKVMARIAKMTDSMMIN